MASTKVFVGSLPPNTKPEELRHLFENYGIVIECDIMNRCGFVHMKNPIMAASAIVGLNATDFKGQTIVVEPGRVRVNESVQRSERSPITHYTGRGGFKNFGRDHIRRSISLASNYGSTQDVNSYHHHPLSIVNFYERPNQRSDVQTTYRGDNRHEKMYQSSRNNFLKSNRPAPYYKPHNNVNKDHAFNEKRSEICDNYDKYYYGRSEHNSRSDTNNMAHISLPDNHYVSKIYSRNIGYSGKYDSTQRNWNSNDRNKRNDNSNYNYSTSARNQSTDYYHHNRHADGIKRSTVEFDTDGINNAFLKPKVPQANSRISNEQRDRRGYALPATSNDTQSYNNWRQQDIKYREGDHSTRMERSHSTASNMYSNYLDIRGRGDYRNMDTDYDSLNYRHEYTPLKPTGRSYHYSTNNQPQTGYSNRPNISLRR